VVPQSTDAYEDSAVKPVEILDWLTPELNPQSGEIDHRVHSGIRPECPLDAQVATTIRRTERRERITADGHYSSKVSSTRPRR
jgi:hypothetical protein